LAIRRTGTSPGDSLAIEDGEQGARAALAAGLPLLMISPRAPKSIAEHTLFRGTLTTLCDVLKSLG
jgi:beta-phosphoglucomutase-like phosphatase (HAD superfamily)